MSNDELLKPRWKVIADYPKSLYHVGDILNGGWRSEDLIYCDTQGPRWSHYPHLFKKLEWWEERELNQMPMFIKNKTARPITYTKVDGWKISDRKDLGNYVQVLMIIDGKEKDINFWAIEPATEDEYNTYKAEIQNVKPN